jgi:two-component system sensor histidine kinase/response regulator
VEDNKTNQFIAESLLKQEGIDTLLASDGKEAVEIYSQNKDVIALILMDLHMPIMDGYEAAEAIRKISSDVPIVAMTADVILGVKEKCEGSGIHHYISKPFKPDQFLAKVRSLLNSDGDVSEQVAILHRASGLKNMGGNADLYQKVLREYFHENRETGDKLTLAVQEKRYEEASHLVHKIKGSSGSIGAKSLYELAAKLQKVLNERNEFEIVTLTNQFTQELSKLLGEISKEEV